MADIIQQDVFEEKDIGVITDKDVNKPQQEYVI